MADPFYIKKFLKASVHGLVGHLTQDNEDQFKKPLCTVYFNVDFERNAKGTVHFNLSKMQPSVLSQLGKVRYLKDEMIRCLLSKHLSDEFL